LTHGLYEAIELPHPPISLRVFLIVEKAIRRAWQILRQRPREGFGLATAREDPLTHELYEVLYDSVFKHALVKGFDRRLLRAVVREPKVRSYNWGSLDKMPDLVIVLVGREAAAKPSQDGLFIECKPVDAEHTVGAHYCDKGLARFVKGEYAWAMSEAMMIGYVTQGYTIKPKLDDALRRRAGRIPTEGFPTRSPHSAAAPFSEPVHVSRHGRTFRYVETGAQAPAIAIRHLWLRRD